MTQTQIVKAEKVKDELVSINRILECLDENKEICNLSERIKITIPKNMESYIETFMKNLKKVKETELKNI